MDNFGGSTPDGESRLRRHTAHARARSRQRGIRESNVELVIEFGDPFHAGAGDMAYFLGWRAAMLARRLAGLDLDRLQNTAVVVLPTGLVRTVIRQCRPRSWWVPAGRRHRSSFRRRKGGRSW